MHKFFIRSASLVLTLSTAALPLALTTRALGAQQAADSTVRRQQRQLDSLATALRALNERLDSTSRAPAPAAPAAPAARGAYMNVSFVGLTDFAWSTLPNVGALQVGDHEPKVRGFSIPNAELSLDGAVDPYFKGVTNIVYKLDSQGETGVELEEMYFLTTSLPHNFQLKGGQYFLEFGRQNNQHPHSWAFADQPLVINRMFGADGLRSQGLRLSWLAPTSFYTEAMVSVVNSAGGTTSSFRSEESPEIHGGALVDRDVKRFGDMLIVPRITTSFDLTNTQTIVLGASAAMGPNNSGADANSKVFGADLYYKWKSPTARAGFPFVSFQSEAMVRQYDAAARVSASDAAVTLPMETLKDRGAYAQVQWGIRPLIVAALRGEYAHGDDAAFSSELRGNRNRISPNLTWFPTEFSKFRVQYNYDHRQGLGVDHTFLMQFEFLLGSHAAHKF